MYVFLSFFVFYFWWKILQINLLYLYGGGVVVIGNDMCKSCLGVNNCLFRGKWYFLKDFKLVQYLQASGKTLTEKAH